MASVKTPKVATWQTLNGEYQQGSFAPFDTIEEAVAIVAKLNGDLGEGSPFHWHVADLVEVSL